MTESPLRVFIGWDRRETEAYAVARASLLRHATRPVDVVPLQLWRLEAHGIMPRGRIVERAGKLFDTVSEAHCSTEFAISRFVVPVLAHKGWALFVDCDVVFQADVAELFAEADERFAVMCVKHPDYLPASGTKMVDQVQYTYPRKNWSSVMLLNCDHAATLRLSVPVVAAATGRQLHRFEWARDEEIGGLSPRWNWLVGERPKPEQRGIDHFTRGGPWIRGWTPAEHDSIWMEAARDVRP